MTMERQLASGVFMDFEQLVKLERNACEAYQRILSVRWEGFSAPEMALHEQALSLATRNYSAAKNNLAAWSKAA